jgi:hypothetical protein
VRSQPLTIIKGPRFDSFCGLSRSQRPERELLGVGARVMDMAEVAEVLVAISVSRAVAPPSEP